LKKTIGLNKINQKILYSGGHLTISITLNRKIRFLNLHILRKKIVKKAFLKVQLAKFFFVESYRYNLSFFQRFFYFRYKVTPLQFIVKLE
jgi:hypothetical protein